VAQAGVVAGGIADQNDNLVAARPEQDGARRDPMQRVDPVFGNVSAAGRLDLAEGGAELGDLLASTARELFLTFSLPELICRERS
jgi:hypothetical protein